MTVVFPLFPRARREGGRPAARRLAGLLLVTACLVFSCREKPTEPPPKPPPVVPHDSLGVELALLEKGVSDAVLKISIPDTNAYRYVELFREGKRILTMNIAGKEKMVEDSALSPGATYTYHALRLSLKSDSFPSAPLRVTTLPLTSHAFSWRIETIGGDIGSRLDDVTIAEDGTIWVVGQIYLRDSTGRFEDIPHNAARWNGDHWEYFKIYFLSDCGRPEISAGEIRAVAQSPDGKIWFTNGGAVVYWENGIFYKLCIPSKLSLGSIYAMYIDPVQCMYVAGGVGSIGYWNGSIYGSIWTKQATESLFTLVDIAGDPEDLYSCGVEMAFYKGVILKKSGTVWKKIIEGFIDGAGLDRSQLLETQLYGTTSSIWMDERRTLYSVGNFLYRFRRGKWDFVRSLPRNWVDGNPDLNRGYLTSVRGNASNDYFVFGQRNTIFHYNGATWEHLGPAFTPSDGYPWKRCAVKRNLAVGVTNDGRNAYIIKLER